MPELPEVQTFRVEFEDYALNHDIVRVKVYLDDILEDMRGENLKIGSDSFFPIIFSSFLMSNS